MQKLEYNRRNKAASIGRKLLEGVERQRRNKGADMEEFLALVEKQAKKLADLTSEPIFIKNAHGVEIDWLAARARMRHDDEALLDEVTLAVHSDADGGEGSFVQRIFDAYLAKYAGKYGKESELAKAEPRISLG